MTSRVRPNASAETTTLRFPLPQCWPEAASPLNDDHRQAVVNVRARSSWRDGVGGSLFAFGAPRHSPLQRYNVHIRYTENDNVSMRMLAISFAREDELMADMSRQVGMSQKCQQATWHATAKQSRQWPGSILQTLFVNQIVGAPATPAFCIAIFNSALSAKAWAASIVANS